jgi:hypothetical protein
VEAQLEIERMKKQTKPETRETFIGWLRIMVVWKDESTPAVLQNFGL